MLMLLATLNITVVAGALARPPLKAAAVRGRSFAEDNIGLLVLVLGIYSLEMMWSSGRRASVSGCFACGKGERGEFVEKGRGAQTLRMLSAGATTAATARIF